MFKDMYIQILSPYKQRASGVQYQELKDNYTVRFTLLNLCVTSAKLTHCQLCGRTLLTIFLINHNNYNFLKCDWCINWCILL